MGERSGFYSLLRNPTVYVSLQALFGRDRFASNVARLIGARPGDRVLDIGCGVGHLVRHLPPEVDYHGFEPNSRYVERARRTFGEGVHFYPRYFGEDEARAFHGADIAIACAVLHHVDDAEATRLFALLHTTLKPGGRVVSLDAVVYPGQPILSRMMAKLDRGRHVRSPEGYRALAQGAFRDIQREIVEYRLPPYSHWIMTATK